MKVFITGATGFVGTHLANRMAQTNHQMYCLVRPTSNTDKLKQLGAVLVPGDVTDRDSLLIGMKGCDWVCHLAATVSFWEPSKQTYTYINVEGTRNLMEVALEMGVSKVVHVSSAVVYGQPAECPFTEESQDGPVRRSEYARTKYAGELVAWQLHEKRGLPLVTVYPGNVMGPNNIKHSSQAIKDFIDHALTAGVYNDSILTLVDVRDVAVAIIKALEKDDNIGEKYLLGKHQLTYREFSEIVSDICGVPLAKAHLPDCLQLVTAAFLGGTRMIFDGSKAEGKLGITYTPIRVSLEETFSSHRELISY